MIKQEYKKYAFVFLWITVICIFQYINLKEYAEMGVTVLNRRLVYLIQTNVQKMFLNANVLFCVFLYWNKKEYLNPIQRVRYKQGLFWRVLFTGFEYTLVFIMAVYLIMPCIAVLLKMQIQVDYLSDMCFAFLIVMQMYLVYSLLYVLLERLGVALVSTVVGYIFLSAITIAIQYQSNVNSKAEIAIYHWTWFLAGDIILSIVLQQILARKDFVSREVRK